MDAAEVVADAVVEAEADTMDVETDEADLEAVWKTTSDRDRTDGTSERLTRCGRLGKY